MIRIDLIQQNSNHLDRRKRYRSRARCEVGGRRYETTGPAPIYKLSTLMWLHGHDGDPTGYLVEWEAEICRASQFKATEGCRLIPKQIPRFSFGELPDETNLMQ